MAKKLTKTSGVAAFKDPIANIILGYKQESESAKKNRMRQNRENFDCYQLQQDFSHKGKGQSKEFLAKQAMAVESLVSFLQQGLIDQGEWFRVEDEDGVVNPLIKATEMQKLMVRQLEKNKFPLLVGDGLKLGALGALMIFKVGGKTVMRSKYDVRPGDPKNPKERKLIRVDKPAWQLDLSLLRHEDYFPDPTGDGLYEGQRIEMDFHTLVAFAKANPDVFDMKAVESLGESSSEDDQKFKKARETGQNVSSGGIRKRVTIYEFWGTFIEQGTGKVLHDNSVAAITSNGTVIRPPGKNPNWHGRSPFVISSILRVPHSVWHKALMDAPTKHNIALNELYNLMLDSGLMQVHGIKQIHDGWLKDPSQVSEGIAPGVTLVVNSQCPPGMKVLERVDTATVSPDTFNMLNLTDREFQASALSSDIRNGALPQRAVKATEIVASNQAITGIFNGLVKNIETEAIGETLSLSWQTMAQHLNDLDTDEVAAKLGKERAAFLANLTPEEIFAATAQGRKFKVFGLSMTLNKIQDFRKITTLLQSIGNPLMLPEFTRKYSMTKLMGEIVKSLDIDEEKILASPEEQVQRQAEMQMQAQAEAQGKGGGKGGDAQSQIPQASGMSPEASPQAPRQIINQGMTTP